MFYGVFSDFAFYPPISSWLIGFSTLAEFLIILCRERRGWYTGWWFQPL